MISVMVSWIYNNAKDVKTEIDNTLRVFALNRKTITQRRKDAMAQGTKVSGYISLGFSIVPVLPTQNSGEPIFIVQK
uniref:Uncharacterized protein n=2 Tax=Candidatus Methanogaster sp. ANME-2c ERB4 TaxID=2759911 RepID=A0A7G9YB17_9EURY|nr:hypothetical protein NANOEKIO_00015 [Methanosarcinales archaeon ANME-2c ERB4]QNO44469.1 hypothetical protein ELEJOALA_00015 [Methanosarcinales archaeon ANME-2c ERB4]QNO45201.1 hypothetical protein KDMJNAGO_00015 [Methanosarcinales archaeon ANME-2c ERB4]